MKLLKFQVLILDLRAKLCAWRQQLLSHRFSLFIISGYRYFKEFFIKNFAEKESNYFFYTNTSMHKAVYWVFIVSLLILGVLVWLIWKNPDTNQNIPLIFVGLLSSYIASYMFYFLSNVTKEKQNDVNRVQYVSEIYLYYKSTKGLLGINWETSYKEVEYLLHDIYIYRKTTERDNVVSANVLLCAIEFLKAGMEQVSISLTRDSIRSSSYLYDNLIAIQIRFFELKEAVDKFYDAAINPHRAELNCFFKKDCENIPEDIKLKIKMFSPLVDSHLKKLDCQMATFVNGYSDKILLEEELGRVINAKRALVMSMNDSIWFPS